jgi:hypothetical protein
MPKKSRRAKAKHRARVSRVVQEKRTPQPKAQSGTVQPVSRVALSPEDSASRYQYVVPELKRIGIIAGAMIVVLIILSIVVPFLRG